METNKQLSKIIAKKIKLKEKELLELKHHQLLHDTGDKKFEKIKYLYTKQFALFALGYALSN